MFLQQSEWVTEGIIPFAEKTYLISANQSTTFRVEDGSGSVWSPTIDSIKSPWIPFTPKEYSVTVNSLLPKNQIYFPNNFTLDLMVNDIPSTPTRQVAGEIRISVDGNQSYAHSGINLFNFSSSIQELNYSIPLTIPDGNHILIASITLTQTPFSSNFSFENPIPNIEICGASLPINIKVDSTKSQTLTTNPSSATNELFQNQPFIIVLIVGTIVVVVLAIMVFAFKRKKQVR